MLVIDEDKLSELEAEFPGKIRVGLAGRYGCRLLAKGIVFEFVLGKLPDGSDTFFVTENSLPLKKKVPGHDKRLFALVRHRAAEAMLAVRNGHSDYNRRRAVVKRKKR